MARFQVRKRAGYWEVWIFRGRSWELLDKFRLYYLAMTMATGQMPYGAECWKRVMRLEWVST